MVTKASGGSLIWNSIAEATMVPMRLDSRRARPTSTMALVAQALINHGARRASAHQPCRSSRKRSSTMPLFAQALINHAALRASAHRADRSSGALLLHQLVGLDDVAFFDVGVAQRETALVAVAPLGDVVLLPAQRLHRHALRDH